MKTSELKIIIKESIKEILLETEIDDLSKQEIVVGDRGLDFLQAKLADLNKKAKRWNLPPLELKKIKEELVKKRMRRTEDGMVEVPSNASSYDVTHGGIIDVQRKQYTIVIEGEAPRVNGYEFIAKIEHTEAGNIINIAPNASIKSLPEEFKKADAECDICHTKRERFNTFVLKKEADGTLVKAGSACLKRFLPSTSVSALMQYALIIEELRSGIADGEFNDDEDFNGSNGPNKFRNYMDVGYMMNALCAAYLISGKYISKAKSQEYNIDSTANDAHTIMFPPSRMYQSDKVAAFLDKARDLMKGEANALSMKILEWAKAHDFDADAEANPDFANLYNNMKVVANSESVNLKNIGYLGAIIPKYAKAMGDIEKQKNKKPSEYVGNVGDKITNLDVTLLFQRSFDGQYGTTILYAFEDVNGNRLSWFSSNDLNLTDKEHYKILVGTVKKQEISKYGGHKETYITRVKLADADGNKR